MMLAEILVAALGVSVGVTLAGLWLMKIWPRPTPPPKPWWQDEWQPRDPGHYSRKDDHS